MVDKYEVVIGIEIYVQLGIFIKVFCFCFLEYGSEFNVNVCFVCMGFFGVFFVLNVVVVEFGVKLGLVLQVNIVLKFKFDRKQYFYFDLLKGYQIF